MCFGSIMEGQINEIIMNPLECVSIHGIFCRNLRMALYNVAQNFLGFFKWIANITKVCKIRTMISIHKRSTWNQENYRTQSLSAIGYKTYYQELLSEPNYYWKIAFFNVRNIELLQEEIKRKYLMLSTHPFKNLAMGIHKIAE